MWVLDTETGQFVQHNPDAIVYAILSHVWDTHGELSYEDLRTIQQDYRPGGHRATSQTSIWEDPRLSSKVRRACERARKDGFRYIWIDSCCIDKRNSAELSEAINSMYAWYRLAKLCYAFLADVPPSPQSPEDVSRSRWFTRGWTLQELIAPAEVVFLSMDWKSFGTKHSMARVLEGITGIDEAVLKHEQSLDEISVARRMSWASGRETTRVEDEAYSLLGIFDISMPPIYGEGRRAFRRLQEEILKRIPDQSLFAWGNGHSRPVEVSFTQYTSPLDQDMNLGATRNVEYSTWDGKRYRPPRLDGAAESDYLGLDGFSLFASCPRDFLAAGLIRGLSDHGDFLDLLGKADVPTQEYTPTPYGIRTQFPLLHLSNQSSWHPEDYQWYIVVLACVEDGYGELSLLGRLCISESFGTHNDHIHVLKAAYAHGQDGPRGLFVLPWSGALAGPGFHPHIHVRTVYLPHPDRASPPDSSEHIMRLPDSRGERSIEVLFPSWARDRLQAQGYRVEWQDHDSDLDVPRRATITLSRDDYTIRIVYQYWCNTSSKPLGVTRLIASVYTSHPDAALSESDSRTQAVPTPARAETFHGIVTLQAAVGRKRCEETINVSLADRGVVLRIWLELASAVCYHLRISDEGPPPKPAEPPWVAKWWERAQKYIKRREAEEATGVIAPHPGRIALGGGWEYEPPSPSHDSEEEASADSSYYGFL
ncbi:heterokaryon incompatibility protein-domain-containing protein [Dichomitus squalens]|uniref:Heterokaryon incompatibility protein-domain-containing protein n=1 Tax=Dichomitus squalens TaxID=114155 RepID=A0A4Q9MAR6_9APHY|nr:heterokaryon incompatibility protein-domain-containing protein [Dichomitus squalens]